MIKLADGTPRLTSILWIVHFVLQEHLQRGNRTVYSLVGIEPRRGSSKLMPLPLHYPVVCDYNHVSGLLVIQLRSGGGLFMRDVM